MAEVNQFTANPTSPVEPAAIPDEQPAFSWTASEFIAHEKNSSWYAAVIVVTILMAFGIYFVADRVSSVIVVIIGILFCVVGARKPRELPYQLYNSGIMIDKKYYPYTSFKSFSIVQEEGIESIWFMPLERFMPGLSIYFAPEQGQKIVDYLGDHLPFEAKELELFDKLMHRIRF